MYKELQQYITNLFMNHKESFIPHDSQLCFCITDKILQILQPADKHIWKARGVGV